MVVRAEIPERFLRAPFTSAQANAAGVPTRVLQGQRFRHLHRGVFVAAALPDSVELRADAARLALPGDAAFSHDTAVELFGLPRPAGEDALHVTVNPGRRARLAGVVAHSASLGTETVARERRLLTSLPRTFVDVASGWGLLDLVVLADAAVRQQLTTPDVLVARAVAASSRASRLARTAAGLVVPKVDSPMETRSRLLLVLSGLPEPEVGLDIFDENGGWIARPDLSYPQQKIAIEYQGDQHRTDKHQWRDDMVGRWLLHDLDWQLIELSSPDIHLRPQRTVIDIHRYLVERGHPAVPAVPTDEWRKYWPAHPVEW